MEVQAILITRLTIGQSSKLLGISKDKLDLETDAVIVVNFPGIQINIRREQDHATGCPTGVLADQEQDAQVAFEMDVIEHCREKRDPIF